MPNIHDNYHRSFTEFYRNAYNLKSGIDFGKAETDRPVEFIDTSVCYTRSADILLSPRVQTANISQVPDNRYLVKAGATFIADEGVKRGLNLSVPMVGEIPTAHIDCTTFNAAASLADIVFSVSDGEIKTVYGTARLTRRLIKLTGMDGQAYVKSSIESALYHAMQTAVICGGGTENVPLGLALSDSLGYSTTVATASAADAIADGVAALVTYSPNPVIIASPAARAALMKLSTGDGFAWQFSQAGQTLYGLPAYCEPKFTGSQLLIGDMANLQVNMSNMVEWRAIGVADGSRDGSNSLHGYLDYIMAARDPAFGVITLS